MAVSELDRQQIAGVIEQYRHGFATMDVEGLKAIWDQDYDHIIYIAQDKPSLARFVSRSHCGHRPSRAQPSGRELTGFSWGSAC